MRIPPRQVRGKFILSRRFVDAASMKLYQLCGVAAMHKASGWDHWAAPAGSGIAPPRA